MSPRRSSELTLEHVLLALLEQQPLHGYDLYQELCQMQGIALIWNIKQASLYAILDKLEGKGLLASRQVPGSTYPPRTYFHLTEAGKIALQTWRQTPVRRARDLRQEFLAKLIVTRRYGKTAAFELIRAQRQTCQAWLDDLNKALPAPDAAQMDTWLVYSYRIQRVEWVLQWLDTCEAEIERLEG